MKKLFYLLSVIALLGMSSCNKDVYSGNENDPYGYQSTGSVLYLATTNQINMNLEPMDIAMKLNILMTEAVERNVEVTDAQLATMRSKLFGSFVAITPEANGSYAITFTGKGPDDLLRSGTVTILTNGTTLDNGNSWSVKFPTAPLYALSSTDGIIFTIQADNYTILSTADNTWRISLTNFNSKYTYNSESTNPNGSKWNGQMTITQTAGDQHYDNIASSIYSLEFKSKDVLTAYVGDSLSIETINPLVFSGSCGKRVVTEGYIRTGFPDSYYDYLDLLSFATMKWTKNTEKPCEPTLKLQYHLTDVEF